MIAIAGEFQLIVVREVSLVYSSVYASISSADLTRDDSGIRDMSTFDSSVNQTLSSMEAELNLCGGRDSGCLSPSRKLRISVDVQRQSTSDDDSGCALEEYAWVPSGLKPDTVHQYFASLPDCKIPYVNSVGEKWRIGQLLWQLPPQDTEPRYCRNLSADEEKELELFAYQRKREALGRGAVHKVPHHLQRSKCIQCKAEFRPDDLCISAARSGDRSIWHPACFVCNICDELLIDLIYFCRDGFIFCGRHHAEQFKPRCGACDEIIFSEECTEAEERSWHMGHFACFECDQQLGGQRYVIRQEKPYCVSCFQSIYAERCTSCQLPIDVDQPHINHANNQWHADERCFCCNRCRKSLISKPFLPRKDEIFCGVDCCVANGQLMIASCRPILADSDSDENIYETVLPPSIMKSPRNSKCMSSSVMLPSDLLRKQQKHFKSRRHRSLSSEKRNRILHRSEVQTKLCGSEKSYRKAVANPVNIEEIWHRNCVESSNSRKEEEDGCSTCSSSSDSDEDDRFLNDYLATSLPRFGLQRNRLQCGSACIDPYRMHKSSHKLTTIKQRSSNCIVS